MNQHCDNCGVLLDSDTEWKIFGGQDEAWCIECLTQNRLTVVEGELRDSDTNLPYRTRAVEPLLL